MIKNILTSLSLCLQGTPLEFRPKRRSRKIDGICRSSSEPASIAPSYLVTTDEFHFKSDLITMLHVADNRLVGQRFQSQRCRAHLFPDNHPVMYKLPTQGILNPQIELYYKKLGLGQLISETPFGC